VEIAERGDCLEICGLALGGAELLALGTREKELAERAAKAEGLSLALVQKEKEREARQNLALLKKRAAKAQEAAEVFVDKVVGAVFGGVAGEVFF